MKRRKMRRNRAGLFRGNGGLLLQQRFSATASQDKDSSVWKSSILLPTIIVRIESLAEVHMGQCIRVFFKMRLSIVIAVKKSRVFDESQAEQFINEITMGSLSTHLKL